MYAIVQTHLLCHFIVEVVSKVVKKLGVMPIIPTYEHPLKASRLALLTKEINLEYRKEHE